MDIREKENVNGLGYKLEVDRAGLQDVGSVWGVIEACAEWLADMDVYHWQDYYNVDLVKKMVAKKDVLMVSVDGEVVGTVTMGTKPPGYYHEPGYLDSFQNPNEPAMYFSALAVKPAYQGRGIASDLIDLVEKNAKESRLSVMRLDCRREVPGLVRFYEKRGYEKVGNLLDEGDDGTYWLMEKRL